MKYLKILFWKAYYYFRPLNVASLGKSSYVVYWARVNGIKIKEIKLGKNSGLDFLGVIE